MCAPRIGSISPLRGVLFDPCIYAKCAGWPLCTVTTSHREKVVLTRFRFAGIIPHPVTPWLKHGGAAYAGPKYNTPAVCSAAGAVRWRTGGQIAPRADGRT